MRTSFITGMFFLLAQPLVAKAFISNYHPAEKVCTKVRYDSLPQKSIILSFDCAVIEESPKINLKEWATYLKKNLALDSASLDTIPERIYQLFVLFVIDKLGNISYAKIQKDPGFGLGKKTTEVFLQSKNCWQPAKRNGRLVKSCQIQPVIFIVEKEKCKELILTEFIL